MKNNKYLNLTLNIVFFLLSIILVSLSISLILDNNKKNIIIIPYIVFEILFIIDLICLFLMNIEFNKNIFQKHQFYLFVTIFIVNIFIQNSLIGVYVNNSFYWTNSLFLWSIIIVSFFIVFIVSYNFIFWKLKIWDEKKNLEEIKNP